MLKPQKSIQDLKNGKVGAVITGCNLITRKGSSLPCNTKWESEGNKIIFEGFNDIKFIKPGTYSFVEFEASYKNIFRQVNFYHRSKKV